MSQVKNKNETATCPALSAYSKVLAAKMDGQNAGGFENRVSQEQGTH